MESHAEQTADYGDRPGPGSPSSLPQSALTDQGGGRDDNSDAKPKTAHGETDMTMNDTSEGKEGTKNKSLDIMEEGGACAPVATASDTISDGADNTSTSNDNGAAGGDGLDDQDASSRAKRPQHKQMIRKMNNNKSSPKTGDALDTSMTVLDIEQGGGGGSNGGDIGGGGSNGGDIGGGDRPSRSSGHNDESMGSEGKSGLSKRSAAQIASTAAAFDGPASSSSLPAQDAKKPPRKSVSARKQSSFVRNDSDERRRSSQIIAAERRAEAQKAAAAAALGVAGGGLAYANMSNHSTNSLRSATSSGISRTKSEQKFQSEEWPSKTVGAAVLPTSAAAPSSDDGAPNSSTGQAGAAMSAQEYLAAQSNSKRGASMESNQTTDVTAPVDSLTANGGSGGDGQQNDKPNAGEGSGTTAALSDTGNGPLFPVKVDGPAMMRKTCLNTNYSLRHQLYLSFGTVSAVALMFVVLVAIITTSLAGNQVKHTS